jgi:hypothetical protein
MNNDNHYAHTPWILWPIRAIFELIEWILRLTGRLVAAIIGLVIMVVGLVLILTIVAIPLGVPMIVFGFLLMIKGIF